MFHLVVPQTFTVVALPGSWGVLGFHSIHYSLLDPIQIFTIPISLVSLLHHGSLRVPSLHSTIAR